MDGIIVKGIGGFYYVRTADKAEYECKARGVFRKERITPMIGDRVQIEIMNNGKGSIVKIHERTSSLVRPPVANIDTLILVVAAASPEPSLFLIDKMLINAEIGGIKPIICINKTDIASREDIEKIYKTAGYEVFTASAEHKTGIEQINEIIKNKITAFAGLSGVGKSSLLNHFGLSLDVGDVSKIERGKHTTRHVELFEVESGSFVMDTPGFSILEITDIEASDIKKYFKEFLQFEGNCRFADCNHFGTKSKDCAVSDAAEKGIVSQTRYESYKQLYDNLKEKKSWEK